MMPSLRLLVASRDARREMAIVDSAEAGRLLDQARVVCEEARADVEQSLAWCAEVSSRCRLGQGQGLRDSLLAGCEALLQQRQQQFVQLQMTLQQAHEHLADMRRVMAIRERDSARLDAWQALEQSQRQREMATRQDLEDEMASGPRSSGPRDVSMGTA